MVKPTDSPFWQAARPSPRPMCVLPVPELFGGCEWQSSAALDRAEGAKRFVY